jgi:uncharacterized protein (TIGR02147 family)
MISIFEYLDYREYLRDFYNEQKKDKTFFSYRYIGRRVGMDSSYVIKVLQGHLHVSKKKIAKFTEMLHLNENEAEFFETLVLFCRAKSERERKLFFDKLFSISSVKAQCLAVHQYEFFQKWYYSAVWSLIDCTPFDGDFKALAERCLPAISVKEAKQSVKLLLKLNLIARRPDGTYHTTSLNLTTGGKWYSQAIEHYQREMIKLAQGAIERVPKKDRDFSTVTISVAEKDLPEIQEFVAKFRTSLIKLINSYSGSDRVYQLNVQLFPMSAEKK